MKAIPHSIIMAEVCAAFQVSSSDLKGRCRWREIAMAKQAYALLCRVLTASTWRLIGMDLHKEHTTVMSAAQQARRHMRECQVFRSSTLAAARNIITRSGDPVAYQQRWDVEVRKMLAEALSVGDARKLSNAIAISSESASAATDALHDDGGGA